MNLDWRNSLFHWAFIDVQCFSWTESRSRLLNERHADAQSWQPTDSIYTCDYSWWDTYSHAMCLHRIVYYLFLSYSRVSYLVYELLLLLLLLLPCSIRRRVRLTKSSNCPISRLIQLQSSRSTVGGRAFSVAGPRVWNNLPLKVTTARRLRLWVLGHRLKAHLFILSYSDNNYLNWLTLVSGPCSKSLKIVIDWLVY